MWLEDWSHSFFILHADSQSDQTYAFWRPHAPPGFAVLGDYLTPLSVQIF